MTQFSNAEWIIDPRARPVPVFRKTFTAHGAAAATLAATAMGVYEITLNGARVDDGYMKPGWTEYKTRLQYQEFDVADALRDGENTLCVCVAPGWCVGEIGHEGYRNFWAKQVECLAQLTITDHAGKTQVIATNESWLVGIGEVIESELYAGERYDARRTSRDWVAAARSGRGKENLIAQEGAPVRVSAAGFAAACGKGNEIAGVVKAVSRGKDACSVQLRGFVTLPYSGTTAPSLGYNALEADGAGGVKVGDTSARERLVVEVDATAGKVTFLL